MNKKRFLIIAIVLFLFIGTGTFVFANPSEEDYSLDGDIDSRNNQTTERIDNDENEDTIPSEENIIEPITENNTNINSSSTFSNWSSTNRRSSASFGANALTISSIASTNTGNNQPNIEDNTGMNTGDTGSSSIPNNPNNEGETGPIITPPSEEEKNPDPEVPTTPEEIIENAKKAVEEAEKSQNRNDINEALDAIKEITDDDIRKELEDRLNELLKLLGAKELVEELKNKVNNAQNKEDIEEARKYRETKKIDDLVNGLLESNDKTILLETLNELAKILDDIEVPIILGIENEFINHEVNITIDNEDNSQIKIVLNDKVVSLEELNNIITHDGVYHLVVTDSAFNQTEITFTIDITKPTITHLKDYYGISDEVKIEFDDKTETTIYLKKDNRDISYNAGDIITEEGEYSVYAIDQAGNISETYTFVVDKTKPVLLNQKDYYGISDEVKIEFDDKTETTIYLKKDNKDISYNVGDIITEEGEYSVYAIDQAGNISETYTFVVDKTKPFFKEFNIENISQTENIKARLGDVIKISIQFNEDLLNAPTIKINNSIELKGTLDQDNYSVLYTIDENTNDGELIVQVFDYMDMANNVGDIFTNETFEEEKKIIIEKEEKKDPEENEDNYFKFIDDTSFSTNEINVNLAEFPNYDYMTVSSIYMSSGPIYSTHYILESNTNTTYTFKIYEKNNTKPIKTVYMDYDNKKPEYTVVSKKEEELVDFIDGEVYTSTKVTFTDQDLAQIEIYQNNELISTKKISKNSTERRKYSLDTISDNGIYKVIAKDRAGNETSVTFTIEFAKFSLTNMFKSITNFFSLK